MEVKLPERGELPPLLLGLGDDGLIKHLRAERAGLASLVVEHARRDLGRGRVARVAVDDSDLWVARSVDGPRTSRT